MSRRSSGRRSPSSKSRRPATKRHYPRTARLNALLREIVADYLEQIDDDRIGLLTVTGVEVDADLNGAEVYISVLDEYPAGGAEPGSELDDHDRRVLDVLGEYRKPLQAEIGRSARLRKTPEVTFSFDPGVRTGARIEGILASLHDHDHDPDLEGIGTDPDPEFPVGEGEA